MGLFDKKYCDICGEKIGLLGNRKLEDGNLCKNCAKKLSPWFSDRRQSTVAEIREQLAYREANREKVTAFRTTRTLGENTKVLLDEDAGLFMLTAARNLEDATRMYWPSPMLPDVSWISMKAKRRSNTKTRRETARASAPGGTPIPMISTL